jgi:amidase
VGLRPSLGRVALYNSTATKERSPGMQLMTVAGPMSRTVSDTRIMLEVISECDERDTWWVPAPLTHAETRTPCRVALVLDAPGMRSHPDVAETLREAARALQDAGYEIEEVEPPAVEAATECYLTIIGAELRTDTIPYMQQFGESNSNIAIEYFLDSLPISDLSIYMTALAERARFAREWATFMEDYPLVLCPISTQPPFEVGFDLKSAERTREVLNSLQLTFMSPLMGIPSISIPTGIKAGIPSGIQLIGPRFREDLCLAAGEEIERRLSIDTPTEPA